MNNSKIHRSDCNYKTNYDELIHHFYKKIPNAKIELLVHCKKNYDKNIENYKNKDWNCIILDCLKK